MSHEFKADLHCHSTFSDGTLSPEEIIRLAKQIGLRGLSITDHDTIEAYEKALQFAKDLEIEMLPGVEFSAMLEDNSVHILGYSFDLNHDDIHSLCRRHNDRRKVRNLAILNKLSEYGMVITEEDLNILSPIGTVGRPHIAQALIKKGHVNSVQEAFEKYLGEGKSCFVKTEHVTVEETIDVIHQANGFAVIAHPQLIKNNRTLKTLLTMPFDGIECYYAKFPHEEARKWIKIARDKNWLITGGSDFHGSIKPQIDLGCSWVPEDNFRKLMRT